MGNQSHQTSMQEVKRELLSSHMTTAEFVEIQHKAYMFLTSLCPNQCGHAKDVGLFKILSYLSYEKPGQYGDEQQTLHHVVLGQDPAVDAKVRDLAAGDQVRLDWVHEYVTKSDGTHSGSAPERPVKKLEKL
eukprot:NODE_2264_length_640_cov_130.986464_g1915_i0.p1 GENE.NODE_2264_length_640_cov_130.986464_g1915_i0~~NODE_2264_length_640_cov_130.986464_g1915_i0.p1  ORF type:complete len:132 (+),score=14.98 NODE_2264_length_640_cov_130.986464_g1915_i0:33-428(+)